MTYSDETLSAYLDDELSSEETAKLDAALADDVALQTRLEGLLRANKAVREAYGPIANEPLPENVVRLLKSDKHTKSSAGGNVIMFRNWSFTLPNPSWAQAMAASVALIAGIILGQYALRPPAGGGSAAFVQVAGEIVPGDSLFETLEFARSSTQKIIDQKTGATAKPLLSFATVDGRLCREFIVALPDETTHAVACKTGTSWEVMIAAKSRKGLPDTEGQYRTAITATDKSVGVFLEDFISGDAFSADEEKVFIESGWEVAE